MTIKLSVSLSNSDSVLVYLAGPCPNLNFEIRNKPEFIRSKPSLADFLLYRYRFKNFIKFSAQIIALYETW